MSEPTPDPIPPITIEPPAVIPTPPVDVPQPDPGSPPPTPPGTGIDYPPDPPDVD